MRHPVTFERQTAQGGFRVQHLEAVVLPGSTVLDDEPDGRGWYLVPDNPGAEMRVTTATLEPALHTEFTALWRDEAIRAFASTHGLLGPPVTGYTEMEGRLVACEALAVWKREILQLGAASRMWNGFQSSDAKEMERGVAMFVNLAKSRRATRAANLTRSTSGSRPGQRNALDPVEFLKRSYELVGRKHPSLTRGAKPSRTDVVLHLLTCMLCDYTQALAPPIYQWMPNTRHMQLSAVPKTLLGALWAGFADGVCDGAEWRKCKRERCDQVFEVSLKGHRKTKLYCSAYCNLKDYRAQQREDQQKGRTRTLRRQAPRKR